MMNRQPNRMPRRSPRSARALAHRNYRLFFFGQGMSLIGTWMQQTALSLAGIPPDELRTVVGYGRLCRPDFGFLASPRDRRAGRPLEPPSHGVGHAVAIDDPCHIDDSLGDDRRHHHLADHRVGCRDWADQRTRYAHATGFRSRHDRRSGRSGQRYRSKLVDISHGATDRPYGSRHLDRGGRRIAVFLCSMRSAMWQFWQRCWRCELPLEPRTFRQAAYSIASARGLPTPSAPFRFAPCWR